jgi:hypothetical protein
MRSSEKTRLAGMATNCVLSEIDTAVGALKDRRSRVNSLGIFTHPSNQRAELAAKQLIARSASWRRQTGLHPRITRSCQIDDLVDAVGGCGSPADLPPEVAEGQGRFRAEPCRDS